MSLGKSAASAANAVVTKAFLDPDLLPRWHPGYWSWIIDRTYIKHLYNQLIKLGLRTDDLFNEQFSEDIRRTTRLLPPHIQEARRRRLEVNNPIDIYTYVQQMELLRSYYHNE